MQHLCRSNRFDQCFCSDLIVLSAKDDITGNTKGVGGAYNVDEVLQLMVHGLNEELEMRRVVWLLLLPPSLLTTTIITTWLWTKEGQLINEDEYYLWDKIYKSIDCVIDAMKSPYYSNNDEKIETAPT